MADLKSVFGPAPDRNALDSLKSRQQYCRYRLQRLIRQEIQELAAPDNENLLALEKIEAKLETLESTPDGARSDLGRRQLGPLLGTVGVIIGFLFGVALGFGISMSAVLALGLGALGFSVGQVLRGKPGADEVGRVHELGRLSEERTKLLRMFAVASLEEAQQRVKRAAELDSELAANVPSGDLAELRPSHEDSKEIDGWDKGRLMLELASVPARLIDLERQWKEQTARHQKHRDAHEAAIRENPQSALDASLKHLAAVADEFGGVSLDVPKDPTDQWFAELDQSPLLAQIEAHRAERLRQLQDCDTYLAGSSEAAFMAQRSDLRQKLKQHEDAVKGAVGRLESLKGNRAGTRELLRKTIRSNAFLANALSEFSQLPDDGHLEPLREAVEELKEKTESLRQLVLRRWGASDEADLHTRVQRARDLRSQIPEAPVTDELLETLRATALEDDNEDLSQDQLILQLKQLPDAIAQAEKSWVQAKKGYDQKTRARAELMSHSPVELLKHSLEQLTKLVSEQLELSEADLPRDPAEWIEALSEDSLHHPVLRSRQSFANEIEVLKRILADNSNEDHILTRLRASRAEITERISDITRRVQQFQGKVAGHRGLFGQFAEAREKLDQAQLEQREVELEASALQLLKNYLDDAKAEIESDLVGPLRDRIDARLLRLTDNRYLGLQMETDFSAERVFVKDQEPVSIVDLSYGTQEQLAFLSRLCLAELLAEEERSLAVFDDNLVHTDSTRMALACEFLEEVAERVQILLFTCHPERFDTLQGKANYVSLSTLTSPPK